MQTKKPLLPRKINALHTALLGWYGKNGRKFQWRESRDPYVILVSEVMLQQTQTARVAEKLPAFLRRFPTVAALARAPRAAVIRAWQGMGYNRRAVHLHECAKQIRRRGKKFPEKKEELIRLPGIGKYTASAITCFAHGQRVPVVDVNIRRVLSRVLRQQTALSTLIDEREIWNIAEALLPRKRFYEWNQALMDIGATVCMRRKAHCTECPLRAHCVSATALNNSNATEPPRSKKAEPSHNGIPYRIWRGRIIELLRTKKTAPVAAIARAFAPAFTGANMLLLKKLLHGLERDGLVKVGKSVSLAE